MCNALDVIGRVSVFMLLIARQSPKSLYRLVNATREKPKLLEKVVRTARPFIALGRGTPTFQSLPICKCDVECGAGRLRAMTGKKEACTL